MDTAQGGSGVGRKQSVITRMHLERFPYSEF